MTKSGGDRRNDPPLIRRSAGMLARPQDAKAPSFSTTPPEARTQAAPPERVSSSPYPAPKVLMGEVMAPRGAAVGPQRDALRAFMVSRHLSPTQWAKAAGMPVGELLGFLAGKTRHIAQASLDRLARAAGVEPEELPR